MTNGYIPRGEYRPRNEYVENHISEIEKSFDSQYPLLTTAEDLKRYSENERENISIPENQRTNGVVIKALLQKNISFPNEISRHAREKRGSETIEAFELLLREIDENNVTTLVGRERINYTKPEEQHRLTLTVDSDLLIKTERHLAVQIAHEIAMQIESGTNTTRNLIKHLREMYITKPAYATLIFMQLVRLNPETNNLNLKRDGIYEISNDLSIKRSTDKDYVKKLFEESITELETLAPQNINHSITLLSQRYPEEEDVLRKKGLFTDSVRPKVVFESSLKILLDLIRERGLSQNADYIIDRLGDRISRVTSRNVTAFVGRKIQPQLGMFKQFLTDEYISSFTSSSSQELPVRIP